MFHSYWDQVHYPTSLYVVLSYNFKMDTNESEGEDRCKENGCTSGKLHFTFLSEILDGVWSSNKLKLYNGKMEKAFTLSFLIMVTDRTASYFNFHTCSSKSALEFYRR